MEGYLMEDILTVQQTANYLKVCEKTVRNLIRENKLGASRVGRTWRIPMNEIDKYLCENRNKGGMKYE